jgi:hypothetical protein
MPAVPPPCEQPWSEVVSEEAAPHENRRPLTSAPTAESELERRPEVEPEGACSPSGLQPPNVRLKGWYCIAVALPPRPYFRLGSFDTTLTALRCWSLPQVAFLGWCFG